MGSMGKGWWRAALRGEPDEEALSWPGQVLSNGHATQGKVLLAWPVCAAYGKPLNTMMRQRGWSRSTFYRAVDTGSQRIADYPIGGPWHSPQPAAAYRGRCLAGTISRAPNHADPRDPHDVPAPCAALSSVRIASSSVTL